MTASRSRPLIVGIGNPQRGDDAIGPLVAERCAALHADTADCQTVTGDCMILVDRLAERDVVILVDACRSGAPPGTLHRFNATEAPLPAFAGGISTHGFGVADAIALADAMNALPNTCIVLAVEGHGFAYGEPLSEPVRAALAGVLADIGVQLDACGFAG